MRLSDHLPGWSNVKYVSVPTIMILPTTTVTYDDFNNYGHVIYALQTNMYWKI